MRHGGKARRRVDPAMGCLTLDLGSLFLALTIRPKKYRLDVEPPKVLDQREIRDPSGKRVVYLKVELPDG